MKTERVVLFVAAAVLAIGSAAQADLITIDTVPVGYTYFVVSDMHPPGTGHGDSYVLPLKDIYAINHARDLIENGPSIGGAIVVARIAAGTDGINRDVLARGQPLWSWHVTEFLGFADCTAEILDGWPGFVEADVEGWIANTGGSIGFWSYTVTQELAVPEPATLVVLGLGALGLLRRKK
jgi:hypothetical protein